MGILIDDHGQLKGTCTGAVHEGERGKGRMLFLIFLSSTFLYTRWYIVRRLLQIDI